MASFLGFIFNAAGIASLGLMASDISSAGKGKEESTHVEILIGTGTEQMGGHWPSVALWNEEGQRIGQGNANWGDKPGASIDMEIKHEQGAKTGNQAAYILLSNMDNDAICISAVYITETKTTTTWFGDVGKRCGMSWYQSNRRIGESGQTPACVWLDNDGSEGINSQALSFHIPDMIANDDRVEQFGEDINSLCKSTPRFSFWGDLEADSIMPFFDPPLEYETDSKSGGIGRDKDVERVKDKFKYDKSVTMYSGGNHKRAWHGTRGEGYGNLTVPDFMLPRQKDNMQRRDGGGTKKGRNTVAKKRGRRGFDNLIVTYDPGHSAKELCESATSYGADTVSMAERIFCDMEKKTMYPLCQEEGDDTMHTHTNSSGVVRVRGSKKEEEKKSCFDMKSKSLYVPDGQRDSQVHRRAKTAGAKAYKTTQYW
ncbi:hypothetical protein PG985_010966 [Apiospora marii]|uniref:Uncharacterized protein n=1 Tax=Apiospora marii TaxID=335849 RepID=A0ABR1SSC3_9PEZI